MCNVVDDEPTNLDMVRLAGQMKKGRGLAMFVGVKQTTLDLSIPSIEVPQNNLKLFLAKEGIQAFARVIVAENRHNCFDTVIQCIGIGAMRPNSVMMAWPDSWKDDQVATE